MANNIFNYKTLPIIEAYKGRYYEWIASQRAYSKVPQEFRYSDGTSDSYVKRGYDEETVQMLSRYESVEGAYRIFTTDISIEFKPLDVIYIGEDRKTITKVLPLMNMNDNLRMYNIDPSFYRKLAVKLIFLE